MKKLFTLAAFALASLNIMATDYKDNLQIEINGKVVSNDQSTISVDPQDNGKYTLSLKNFQFKMGVLPMKVGNIIITDVPGVSNGVNTMIKTSQEITITAGDSGKGWIGPGLGKVPVNMVGEIRENTFYTIININMASLNQQIKVTFGTDGYQIPNSDFEEFHNEKGQTTKLNEETGEYDKIDFDIPEPNHWHSFGSATGGLVSVVKMNKQSDMSEDVREGATGKKCAKVVSALEFGSIPANGTLTTGQLQASGFTPDSPLNCAFLDLTNEERDANGDPFYVTLNAKPDSVKFWVRFKQGTLEKPEYKYASFNAVLTDGTRYQDPQDPAETYKNIVGMATDKTIDSKEFTWHEVVVPFDYETYKTNGATPKAILVTISTNSVPGAASTDAENPDELYVDDLSLVYNAGLKSVKFKGENVDINEKIKEGTVMNAGSYNLNDFVVEANGAGAYVTKELVDVYDPDFDETTTELHITVTSADLQTENKYIVNINGGTPTGIKSITLPNGVQAIYNINGQKVSNMVPGQVYIVKTTDGKTKKFIKK